MSDLPAPPSRSSNLPTAASMLDRHAVERVLARAAELQAGALDGTGAGLLSEQQIIELGQEVGLTPEVMRQALAEERTRISVPPEEGWMARLVGPAAASATRVVPGTPAAVLERLDSWMQRDECLRVKRRFGDRLTWEPRRDVWGNLRRGLNLGGRSYDLARAEEVAATVVAVDDARVLIRLDANLAGSRASRVRAGGISTAVGVAGGGVAGLVAAMVVVPTVAAAAAVAAVAALPVAMGAGAAYAIARKYGDAIARAQLALEQLLDRLERNEGPSPPQLLGGIF